MTHSSSPSQAAPSPYLSEAPRLGLLIAAFYILFTLLPDSSSRLVSWPWVFLWQVWLICPVLWLLWFVAQQPRLRGLGNGLDWVVALTVLGLVMTEALSGFAHQARWYGWAALCFMAALYALSYWLRTPQRRVAILVAQGYLSLAFIAVSLLLWLTQTLLPELKRLGDLRQQSGVNLPFDFSTIELRNWAPIGHQNYVAGYLLLMIPLLVGLALSQPGKQRWLWWGGVGCGILDLYTTNSRSGWLGLAIVLVLGFGVALFQGQIPRRRLALVGGGTLLALAIAVLANERLRSLVGLLQAGKAGGELAYRTVTTTIGWLMGSDHLGVGVGPGGVPQFYQQYRPVWAGQVAEWAYQLHSTPAQLWAEMSLWGILPLVWGGGLLAYLGWRWWRLKPEGGDRLLLATLYGSLLAYSIQSLTDYQLDNPCISGAIVLFLAVLAAEFQQVLGQKGNDPAEAAIVPKLSLRQPSSLLALAGLGLILVIIIWLFPLHRAWMLSSQGFLALEQLDSKMPPEEQQSLVKVFTEKLTEATRLAPGEPYYPSQLGWNLGNLASQTNNPQWQQQAISAFQQAVTASPYQEFNLSSLGWLQVSQNPPAATQAFTRALRLTPAKRGLLYGLGLSLLAQGKTNLATDAIALESLRDPQFLASPFWRNPALQPLYTQVTQKAEALYEVLLQRHPEPGALNTYLHQSRGGLRWWLGNLPGARTDLKTGGDPVAQTVLDLAEGKPGQGLAELGETPAGWVIAAWLKPSDRPQLLQKAWVTATRTAPPKGLIQQMVEGMAKSTSFDQWLKQNAPSRTYRRERAGFGVLSRHIDGPIPKDFLRVEENIALTQLLPSLLPTTNYLPELDLALQPLHLALLQQAQRSS